VAAVRDEDLLTGRPFGHAREGEQLLRLVERYRLRAHPRAERRRERLLLGSLGRRLGDVRAVAAALDGDLEPRLGVPPERTLDTRRRRQELLRARDRQLVGGER